MDQLTGVQLSEWEAYDRLDPIGTWRDDFRLAYISSLLTNLTLSVHGKKGVKMTNPMEFMLDWSGDMKSEPKQQSVEQMKSFLMQFAKEQNKRAERSKARTTPPVKKDKK